MGGPIRVVILGKTGTGKSSTANTIFGDTLFNVSHTSESETRKCQAETRSVHGRNITLIDTPGFFDTDKSEQDLKPEIIRFIVESTPGPHAFLIVLKVEKFTEQEQAVIDKIRERFSEEVFKYAAVVFTHGDLLQEGQTIEDFVGDNKNLKELVEKCGGRCHVIDNKYWKDKATDEYRSNKFQVEKLLQTIDKMIEDNDDGCFTNEMLQEVEEKIQREMKTIKESAGSMSEEEIRRKAVDIVKTKLPNELKSVSAGVLLGAFLGAAPLGVAALIISGTAPVAVTVAAVGAVIGGVVGYVTGKIQLG